LKPARNLREVPTGQSVALSELLRGQPVVVVRRFGVLEFIEVFFECLLLLGRASQLEHQVLHRNVVRNRAAIIGRRRFWARIARERDQRILVDRGGDERRHSRVGTEGGPAARQQCQGADGDDTHAFEMPFH